MHILIVHPEAEYFAGAERVLGVFLEGLRASSHTITVAAVRESRVVEVIPTGMHTCWLPSNAKFSFGAFSAQIREVRRLFKQTRFDLIHGWAARDWELTALNGKVCRCPTVGTLHDHPRAAFISGARQRMMAWSAAFGLDKVVCVSEAVRGACLQAGYQARRLEVVRNGLPRATLPDLVPAKNQCRFGYLGQFSERKGLRGLFQMVDEMAGRSVLPWELALAGDAQEAEGRKLVEEIKQTYQSRRWWPQVRWCGWVKRPAEFLASLDVLVCPSTDFDPFPTVLLEAGQAGVPVIGARVGGVPEIIQDQVTGWLFEPCAWSEAALLLERILAAPELAKEAGARAKKRVEQEFAIGKMVTDYLKVYSDLARI